MFTILFYYVLVDDILLAKFAIFSIFVYLILCSCNHNICYEGMLPAKLSVV